MPVGAILANFDCGVSVTDIAEQSRHEVRTFANMQWDAQLENGKLLNATEEARFDGLVTSDHNIRYQQNLSGRRLSLVVLGSNIWPIVREYAATIKAQATQPPWVAFLLPRCSTA